MLRFPALVALAALTLAGCPAVNSRACADDSECFADQRCRRGACGPICLDDSECGDAQVCRSGLCKPKPECSADVDCGSGFVCLSDRCQCTADTSCAANQACSSGTCQAKKKCTADADCLSKGGRCEITQGVCLPACSSAHDCAPDLDPRAAFALYGCIQGACTRHCATDLTCGPRGFVCKAGLCAAAECAATTDCPAGQYCTSTTTGRCLSYTVCNGPAECARNTECRAFEATQCPPGFDCGQRVCQELPRCLADADCVTGLPGTPQSSQLGYCFEGHCQPSSKCSTDATCGAGKTCIAQLCVPAVCRGHAECGTGAACVDGTCSPLPAAGDLALLRVWPDSALIEVGDTLQLRLLGFTLDGASAPLPQGTFTVLDPTGRASTAASVSPAGLLTATSEGKIVVKASILGSTAVPAEAHFTLVAPVTAGHRVLVIDAANHLPLAGVKVRACVDAACAGPADVVTDAEGIALFHGLPVGPLDFTAVAAAVRVDGLPAYERATVLGTSTDDLLLPLRANPVHGAAGFNASLSFSDVSTSGAYWAGIAATSFDDLAAVTPQGLVGENFMTELPGLNQSVPIPSALVLYTSPAFGIPQEVKARSLGTGQPGARSAIAFAGRMNLDQVLTLRSTDLLGYLGAFDYALEPRVAVPMFSDVPDTTDLNGNGLCSSASRCPLGKEDVPDYANFAALSMQPRRQQQLRTEVILPNVPSTFDTVLVCALEIDAASGALPVGFASRTAGAPGQAGTRPVDPVVLRSGPPYGGLELASPGVWSLAGNANGTAFSGRLSRADTLPKKLQVAPFLPTPANDSWSVAKRAFQPGQPAWASASSTGAELARVGLTGTQQRHAIYFSIQGTQTEVDLPPSPAGPGIDPMTEARPGLDVVVVDLPTSLAIEEVFSLPRANLTNWLLTADGFARSAK